MRLRISLGMQSFHQKTGENCQKNTITIYSVYSQQTAIFTSILSILILGAELMDFYTIPFILESE